MVSRFTTTAVIWSISGLLAVVSVGCTQDKPQDLNPPPVEPAPVPSKAEAKPAAVPTQPLAVTPAPPTPATVPTTPAPGIAPEATTLPTHEPAPAPPGDTATTKTADVTLPPTTAPSSEPVPAPAAAPATNPADSAPSHSTARSFTGTLHGGVVAAGSETTGWALQVDGATGAIDIDVTAISGQVKSLDGRHVTITGQLKEKDWLERGKTQLLIADTITVAPLPDMNK